eukprot:TRINITY_DN12073_c0_g1_i2.p1 TRINITY_DN12073_c0_g1~~TRINITY_DN12073_c0_g1_i2.p1  ORF type:complete len:294 (-),score=34.62 TRINITY_DN12073_c0_g1_i2:46-927(-)
MTCQLQIFFLILPYALLASSLTFLSYSTAQILISITPQDSTNHYKLRMRDNSSEEWKFAVTLTPPNNIVAVKSYDDAPLSSAVTYTFEAMELDDWGAEVVPADNSSITIRVGDPVSLEKSEVQYSELVYLEEETVVTLEAYTSSGARKTIGGDVIYLNVTNGCKKGLNIYCVRLGSNDLYYSNNVLSQPLLKRMTDHKNGTYKAKYTITETENTGYISLIFLKMTNGKIYGECFADKDFTKAPIEKMLGNEFGFFWKSNKIICGNKSLNVNTRWVGAVPVSYTHLTLPTICSV